MQTLAARAVGNLISHLINPGIRRIRNRAFLVLALLPLLFPTSALAATPDSFQHQVSDGTTNLTANFTRFSNRGPNFRVVLQQANGSFRPLLRQR